ncbi:MAG: hypothetical protein RLY86_736 [Pseudomonadota bacterium]|jgi:uncharacterized protein YigA (DUF484 family)
MAHGPITSPLGDDLTAEDVAAYLRENPDFLARRTDLIPLLVPPSADRGQGVVDMQVFLLERLRVELAGAQAQQRELIATTRANLNNQNRVHAAALFLLDAQDLSQLFRTVTTDLAVLLDLDVTALVVEGDGGEAGLADQNVLDPAGLDPAGLDHAGVLPVPPGMIDQWLGRRDVLLNADIEGLVEIYGPRAAPAVRSEALVRLRLGPGGEGPQGLLALGSREPDMFHPGQGTELLTFLARVVERVVRLHQVIPAPARG